MIKISLLLVLACIFSITIKKSCIAQKIQVKSNNVTQIVFPAEIEYFKGGFLPEDLMVENVKNVLFITPIYPNIKETNICIVTKEGMYFNLILSYHEQPTKQSYVLTRSDAFFFEKEEATTIPVKESPKDTLAVLSEKILSTPGFITTGNTVRYKNFFFHLKGIYVYEQTIFIRLNAVNKSNIRFDFDYIAFYINAAKKRKNTTSEQLQLFPIRDFNYKTVLESTAAGDFIFALNKFTIGAEKSLNIDLIEKDGERNLKLKIDDKILLNAQKIEL